MTLGQKRRHLNREINKWGSNLPWTEWEEKMDKTFPEIMDALEGNICDRIHVPLSGFYNGLWIDVGLHQVHPKTPVRVEYAYVS